MDYRDNNYTKKTERRGVRLTRKQQSVETTKNILTVTIALFVTFVMVTVMINQLASATTSMAMYPKSFIPFWSEERRGHETTLLNTNQIVRIEPIFDPSIEDPDHKVIVYLRVHLTDGKSITVQEDFEDFYSRVRVSQSK